MSYNVIIVVKNSYVDNLTISSSEEFRTKKAESRKAIDKQVIPIDDKLLSGLTDDEYQVFEHWRQTLNHPSAKPTPDRKRAIAKALKYYKVIDLQLAISGCKLSDYHMGKNESQTVYDSIELILRNSKNIESFIAKTGKR